MDKKRATIYLSPPITQALKNSTSAGKRLGQICDRYLEIVRDARIHLKLTSDELTLIVKYCSGITLSPARIIALDIINCLIVADIESLELEDKLCKLTYPEHIALAEYIEQSRRI